MVAERWKNDQIVSDIFRHSVSKHGDVIISNTNKFYMRVRIAKIIVISLIMIFCFKV